MAQTASTARPDDLLTLGQASRLSGISRRTLLRWVQNGRLVGFRLGHRFRVRRIDLLRFMTDGLVVPEVMPSGPEARRG